AIAIGRYKGLHEPAGLRKRACTQVGFHVDLKQTIRYPFGLRFHFTQTDMSKLGVGKQTIWDLPARGHTVAAGYIGVDYAEIVDADVRELRAACDLANRPDVRRGGLQP